MLKFAMGFMIGFMVGILFVIMLSPIGYPFKQLEVELKHELQNKANNIFYLAGTNIQITKKADGSGIVRIMESRE